MFLYTVRCTVDVVFVFYLSVTRCLFCTQPHVHFDNELIEYFQKLKAVYNSKKNVQCASTHKYTNQWYTECTELNKHFHTKHGKNTRIQHHVCTCTHTHTHTHKGLHAHTMPIKSMHTCLLTITCTPG